MGLQQCDRALGRDQLEAVSAVEAHRPIGGGPRADEHAIGALMMHFMLETIIAADLLGVNPFDQPAVEEGKVLAKTYLAGA